MELIDRLPSVRGKLSANVPLAPYTWLRVGGPAEVLFMPKDEADLAHFLSSTPDEIPVTILGVASNTCLLYTSPSPRDRQKSRMPSSA